MNTYHANENQLGVNGSILLERINSSTQNINISRISIANLSVS